MDVKLAPTFFDQHSKNLPKMDHLHHQRSYNNPKWRQLCLFCIYFQFWSNLWYEPWQENVTEKTVKFKVELTCIFGKGLMSTGHPADMFDTKRLILVRLQYIVVQTLTLWVHSIRSSVEPSTCDWKKSIMNIWKNCKV
jgi:hypothetical protein